MDIKIELDRSDYVNHRLYLMKSLQIPTLSEAKTNLGSCLAQILFDQCDVALKVDFGLTPLKGTGDELWVSPSDLLIGKVALKPPLTSKHIQALTHKGILEIGEEIERKFWNETKMHEENYFDARKRHIMDQFEELFRVEARNIELRERANYQAQNQKMLEEFSEILLEELSKLEETLKLKQEEQLKMQKITIDQKWENKFQEQIDLTVRNMSQKFIEELDKQKSILVNNFKFELQKVHLQRGFDVTMEKTKCNENMKQLRHNLECKNIANMMYILCMERRKCCDEKNKIEQYYMKELKRLRKLISNKDNTIKKLTKEKNKQIKEVSLRESCLLEIIRQFQKFINFALRAAPTQAEFLLSIEKMMAFELTNTVLRSNYSHLKRCNEILPWKEPLKSVGLTKTGGLEIQDHHNCFKELPEPVSGTSARDYLPAVTYRDNLYVREDFRNMISQGIEITKSNELWSKDVEILIQTLREHATQEPKIVEPKIVETKIEEPKVLARQQSSEVESASSTCHKSVGASSVQFMLIDHDDDDEVSHRLSVSRSRAISTDEKFSQLSRGMSEDRRGSLKPVVNSLHTIIFEEIGIVEKTPAIIAATNSLELILKRGSVKPLEASEEQIHGKDEDEVEHTIEIFENTVRQGSQGSFGIIKKRVSNTDSDLYRERRGGSRISSKRASPKLSLKDALVLDAKDSIIMKKSSLAKKSKEFNISPKDSIELRIENKDLKRQPSRLVTAKNSIELLRESRMHINELSNSICSSREQARAKSSISCSKIKCSEKCGQAQRKDTSDDLEVITNSEEIKYMRRESGEKSIKLSHIEIFRLDDNKEPNVAINVTPMVYKTESETYSTDLTKVYKAEKQFKKPKKKTVKSTKDKLLDLPNIAEVVGDKKAKEHLLTTYEFTEDRIHSLIELIKDNPTLMRTFTACRR